MNLQELIVDWLCVKESHSFQVLNIPIARLQQPIVEMYCIMFSVLTWSSIPEKCEGLLAHWDDKMSWFKPRPYHLHTLNGIGEIQSVRGRTIRAETLSIAHAGIYGLIDN